jgi:homocysteine S-methyltransferase
MRRTPPFSQRLDHGVILTDGAMGTYLHTQGVPMDRCFAELCLTAARTVEAVHREYVDAGAEVLTTNSYGANRIQLDRQGLGTDLRRINIAAARLARQASEGRAYVAGSVGPLGAALEPLGPVTRETAFEVFHEQVTALAEGGVDYIVIETISDLAEFDVALAAARAACDLPIVVHKTFTEDGTTLMGELPHEVVARAAAAGAVAVGANCTVGPQRMVDIIERMAERAEIPLSAMPTAGLPRLVDGKVHYHAEASYMASYARLIAEAGATIVGACCGSTPAHIAAMAKALRGVRVAANRATVTAASSPDRASAPAAVAGESRLARRLGNEFVTAVDIELPRGHDLSDVLSYARTLQSMNVDTLMLSDALRARLFVHPLVVAHRLQEELDLECVLPYHTRDKNILGIQSDLLAAHVLGVRNLFVSLSEPASLGDYPNGLTLSDLGADGLLRILAAMNRGLDLAENTIGSPTSFVPLIGGDPNARDAEVETERLAIEIQSGAVGVVTPPQFDVAAVTRFVADLGGDVPVMVGVLPLRSAQHADYLHNEVPGIRIPDAVRQRMADSRDPATTGICVARELLEALPEIAAGAHVAAPYRKRDRALEALEALRLHDVHTVSGRGN